MVEHGPVDKVVGSHQLIRKFPSAWRVAFVPAIYLEPLMVYTEDTTRAQVTYGDLYHHFDVTWDLRRHKTPSTRPFIQQLFQIDSVTAHLACWPLASGYDPLADLVRALVWDFECAINSGVVHSEQTGRHVSGLVWMAGYQTGVSGAIGKGGIWQLSWPLASLASGSGTFVELVWALARDSQCPIHPRSNTSGLLVVTTASKISHNSIIWGKSIGSWWLKVTQIQ